MIFIKYMLIDIYQMYRLLCTWAFLDRFYW